MECENPRPIERPRIKRGSMTATSYLPNLRNKKPARNPAAKSTILDLNNEGSIASRKITAQKHNANQLWNCGSGRLAFPAVAATVTIYTKTLRERLINQPR
jgi:hypothetical protein